MASKKKSPSVKPVQRVVDKPGIAFEIKLDEGSERPQSAGRERLMRQAPKSQISLQDVKEKQQRAEERRNAVQAEKLHKIQTADDSFPKGPRKIDKADCEETSVLKAEAKPFDENEIVPALKHKTGLKTNSLKDKNPASKSIGKNLKNSKKV